MFDAITEILPNPFEEGSVVEAVRGTLELVRGSRLRRGKVKEVYSRNGELLIFFTDRVSAFDVVLEDLVPLKGAFLAKLSALWFEKSASVFPNHFIELVDDRTLLVSRAQRVDIEWIVRGYIYGSMWRAYEKGERIFSGVELPSGLRLAEKLPEPVLTPTTKSDVGHDVEITKEQAISLGLVKRDEWAELEEASLRLYEFYSKEAEKRGIIVADVKLEFGRTREGIIQIDEPPTHDSARLWSAKHYEPGRRQESFCLDKEFLRAYLQRRGYRGEGSPPRLPGEIVRQVALRARGAYEVLAGKSSIESLGLRSLEELEL